MLSTDEYAEVEVDVDDSKVGQFAVERLRLVSEAHSDARECNVNESNSEAEAEAEPAHIQSRVAAVALNPTNPYADRREVARKISQPPVNETPGVGGSMSIHPAHMDDNHRPPSNPKNVPSLDNPYR